MDTNNLAINKVLILYILNTINREITENDFFKILSLINNINYFYFKQIISDLVDSKLVETYSNTNDEDIENIYTIYEITSEGKSSLDLTIDILPGLLKLKADTILKNEIKKINNESSIITEFIPENENSYTVKCKIVEKNKIFFEVKTFAGSVIDAKKISDNWKNNAYNIYPKILDLLTGEKNS